MTPLSQEDGSEVADDSLLPDGSGVAADAGVGVVAQVGGVGPRVGFKLCSKGECWDGLTFGKYGRGVLISGLGQCGN